MFNFFKTAILITLFSFQLLFGQQTKAKEVIWSPGVNLRNLAEEHLGNPNLWQAILSFNNIAAIGDLKDGMKLFIPQKEVLDVINTISEAEKKMTTAIDNGSKIFANEESESALKLLNTAIQLKNSNKWREAAPIAKDALTAIENTLKKTLEMREQSVDAYISKKKGTVQNKRPNFPNWNNASLFEKLFELDLARTLSSSYAEITFVDLNQIRLNENSQAVILKSRINLLNNKTQSQVKLEKGDAYAKLFNTPKKQFDLNIEGVKTKVNSNLFWVDKKDAETKVANYKGEITLEAKGKEVLLKENQGSKIPIGGPPTDPKNLLSPPALLSPINFEKFFHSDVTLSWEQIENAFEYWIEIATEPRFSSLFQMVKNVRETSFTLKNLPENTYYWRIASVDNQGFPGKFSNHFIFTVEKDITPPFLQVLPVDKFLITKENKITFNINTENDARLSINKSDVIIDNTGNAAAQVSLSDGLNIFEIVAIDKSGNKSLIVKEVFAELFDKVELKDENKNIFPDIIKVSKEKNSLSGFTRPYSSVKIKSNKTGMETSTYADSNGQFKIAFPRMVSEDELHLSIVTRAGYLLNKIIQFE